MGKRFIRIFFLVIALFPIATALTNPTSFSAPYRVTFNAVDNKDSYYKASSLWELKT